MNWDNYQNWLKNTLFNEDGNLKTLSVDKLLDFSSSRDQEKELRAILLT